MSAETAPPVSGPLAAEESRRDLLTIGTGAVAAVTLGAAVWPLVDQMNPSASVLALSTIEIDIADLAEGEQITVKWRGKPVFVRHRTAAEIEAARATPLTALVDINARRGNDPAAEATDPNRALDPEGRYVMMMGVCTHLGCVPLDEQGDFGGWFCPCHGSHYDTAGRIRKGPAPENLHIPRFEMEGTIVRLLDAYKP
jgi:ubiquinol-cytochrome c reductase iron-sulfur subunit